MIKKIMKDPIFLALKSENATEADKQVVIDLMDTLKANLNHCVGRVATLMAKNNHIKTIIGVLLLIASLVFILIGIVDREVLTVFNKAVMICMECIGIG